MERALNEFCVTHDTETAMTRVDIWLAGERREGGVEALRKAAKLWGLRRIAGRWLDTLADKLERDGAL